MDCPHCGKSINAKLAAKALGSLTSDIKASASRENGKLGGRPKQTAPRCLTCGVTMKANTLDCPNCGGKSGWGRLTQEG